MNEEQHTTVDEIKSTVAAFSDWLDLNSDGYLMIITKGEDSILAAKGKHDQMVNTLASGMMEDDRIKAVILDAVKIVMAKTFKDRLMGKQL